VEQAAAEARASARTCSCGPATCSVQSCYTGRLLTSHQAVASPTDMGRDFCPDLPPLAFKYTNVPHEGERHIYTFSCSPTHLSTTGCRRARRRSAETSPLTSATCVSSESLATRVLGSPWAAGADGGPSPRPFCSALHDCSVRPSRYWVGAPS
jgi:hypothetical protein